MGPGGTGCKSFKQLYSFTESPLFVNMNKLCIQFSGILFDENNSTQINSYTLLQHFFLDLLFGITSSLQ